MLNPFRLRLVTEVAPERFLAPLAVHGVTDRCEGRDGFVFSGVAEVLSISITHVQTLPIYIHLRVCLWNEDKDLPKSKHHAHPYYDR